MYHIEFEQGKSTNIRKEPQEKYQESETHLNTHSGVL